uniref:Uncharacterized protein n=1 Tax=Glossina austeni TaxID=7395 RepID=A0A1A9VNS0_GLOAU
MHDKVVAVEAIANSYPYGQIIDAAKMASIHDFITSLPQHYDTLLDSKGIGLSPRQKHATPVVQFKWSNMKRPLLPIWKIDISFSSKVCTVYSNTFISANNNNCRWRSCIKPRFAGEMRNSVVYQEKEERSNCQLNPLRAKHSTNVIDQALYSPDKTPLEFFLFPTLNYQFEGHKGYTVARGILPGHALLRLEQQSASVSVHWLASSISTCVKWLDGKPICKKLPRERKYQSR